MHRAKKLNLILTQKQQVRAWFASNLLNTLSENFNLSIIAPENCKSEISLMSSHLVEYYKIPDNVKIERALFVQLLIHNRKGESYRSITRDHLRLPRLYFSRRSSLQQYFSAVIRQVRFYFQLLIPLISRIQSNRIEKYLHSMLLDLPEADLTLLVANANDLKTELISASLNHLDLQWMLVAENWDNISSKLATHRNPSYLGVWSPQNLRQAEALYGYPKERIKILGSSRINLGTLAQLASPAFPLGKPANAKNLRVFYPGAGVQYETYDFIFQLKKNFNRLDFPVDLIYRPHPLSVKEHGAEYYKRWEPEIEIDWPAIPNPTISDWPVLDISMYEKMITSEVVIGSPTTFLLEAIVLGKLIVLDMRPTRDIHSPQTLFQNYTHFKEILDSDGIPQIRFPDFTNDEIYELMNLGQNLDDLKKDLLGLPKEGFDKHLVSVVSDILC